jgi:hypothetical protein
LARVQNSSPNHIVPVPVERRRVLRANVSPSSATTVSARMELPHSQCPKRSTANQATSRSRHLKNTGWLVSPLPSRSFHCTRSVDDSGEQCLKQMQLFLLGSAENMAVSVIPPTSRQHLHHIPTTSVCNINVRLASLVALMPQCLAALLPQHCLVAIYIRILVSVNATY